MKTLKNSKTGEIKRLHDQAAQKLVLQTFLGWEYTPKSEWKKDKSVVTVEMPDNQTKKSKDEGQKSVSYGKGSSRKSKR
jgi:hypothetical protein